MVNSRNRRQPHHRRMTGASADSLYFCHRLKPQFPGFFCRHENHGCRSVIKSAGITCSDLSGSRDKTRRKISKLVDSHAWPEMFILVKQNRRFFPLRYFNRNDFFPESTVQRCPFRIIMASESHFIHFFPADMVKMGYKLGGVTHNIRFSCKRSGRFLLQVQRSGGIERKKVRTAVKCMHHGIHKNLILQATSPPCSRNRVRHTRHVLNASCQNNVRHSGLNHGHTGNYRFHSGNADPVDSGCSHRIRNPGHQRSHSGYIQRIVMFHTTAIPDIIDHCRIDSGTLDSFFHGNTGQDCTI